MVGLQMGEEEEKWLFSSSGSQKVQRMIRHRVGPIAVEENFPVLGVEQPAAVSMGRGFQHVGGNPVVGIAAPPVFRDRFGFKIGFRLQHFVGVSQSGGQVPFSDVTGFVTGFF